MSEKCLRIVIPNIVSASPIIILKKYLVTVLYGTLSKLLQIAIQSNVNMKTDMFADSFIND